MAAETSNNSETTEFVQSSALQNDQKPSVDTDAQPDGQAAATKPARRGLLRFKSTALSVLTKVLESREEEECDPLAARRGTRSRSVPRPEKKDDSASDSDYVLLPAITRRRSSTMGSTGEEAAKIIQSVQAARRRSSHIGLGATSYKQNFADVVRLMSLQKQGTRRKSVKPQTEPTKPKIDLSEIKPDELPDSPRFSATLSETAQYVTLQGYGDKLANILKNSNHPDWRNAMARIRTPAHRNQLILEDLDHTGHEIETPKLPRIKDIETTAKSTSRRSHSKSRDIGTSSSVRFIKPKQLKVTHRLEYAMDIIDKVKASRGEVTTTPRMRVKSIEDPLLLGESWLDSWDKEFSNSMSNSQ